MAPIGLDDNYLLVLIPNDQKPSNALIHTKTFIMKTRIVLSYLFFESTTFKNAIKLLINEKLLSLHKVIT